MKFKTAYDCASEFSSPTGNRIKTVYKRVIHSNGSKDLVENGKEDIYEYIQLAGKGCLLRDLIKRAQCGDAAALDSRTGGFGDFTNAPGSLIEAENSLLKAREIYDHLPVETKQKYNSSFVSFLEAVDNGSFVKNSYYDTNAQISANQPKDPTNAELLKMINDLKGEK